MPESRQLVFLAFPRRQFLQLVGCVAQELLLALGFQNGIARGIQAFRRGLPGAVPGGNFVAQIRRDPVSVEQAQMHRGIGEAHLIVLTLHLHQHRADSFQGGGADRRVIHPGTRTAIPADRPAQHDVAVIRQPEFLQRRVHGVRFRRRETGGDAGLFGTRADQPCIRARAECEPQAVQQDGFPGAGLAGQDGQVRAEPKLQPLDQHHVAYREVGQHGWRW